MGLVGLFLLSLVLISCCFVVSWLGAAAKYRSLTRRILELEYQVEDQAGRLMREVKIRAGTAGLKAKEKDQELLAWAENEVNRKDTGNEPLTLSNWINSKFRQ